MSELSYAVVIIFIGIMFVNHRVNHIPKTGRDADANGEKIIAKITNSNKMADRSKTMYAECDGKRFKVKIKATEANLWTKGDEIEILLSSEPKKYRILFNDYFRKNEMKIREDVLSMLKKMDMYLVAKAIAGYKKEHYGMFLTSKMETKRIFSFITYMKMIDIYSVVAAIGAAAAVIWWKMASPAGGQLIAVSLILLLVVWSVYGAVTMCKRILKQLENSKKD